MSKIRTIIFASVFVIVLATFCTFLIGTQYTIENNEPPIAASVIE